jgi:hypothetical protein
MENGGKVMKLDIELKGIITVEVDTKPKSIQEFREVYEKFLKDMMDGIEYVDEFSFEYINVNVKEDKNG